jgi:hypothetical protein
MSKLTRPKPNKFFWWTEYVDEKGFESMAFNTNYAEIAEILAWFIDQTKIFEQERIIKLLEEIKIETLTPEEAIAKGWKWNEIDQMWWLPQNSLIALIKGENK